MKNKTVRDSKEKRLQGSKEQNSTQLWRTKQYVFLKKKRLQGYKEQNSTQ